MVMRAVMATSSLYMADNTVSFSGCRIGSGCADIKLCSHITECAFCDRVPAPVNDGGLAGSHDGTCHSFCATYTSHPNNAGTELYICRLFAGQAMFHKE